MGPIRVAPKTKSMPQGPPIVTVEHEMKTLHDQLLAQIERDARRSHEPAPDVPIRRVFKRDSSPERVGVLDERGDGAAPGGVRRRVSSHHHRSRARDGRRALTRASFVRARAID